MFFAKKLSKLAAKKCKAKLNLNLTANSEDFLKCHNVKTVGKGLRPFGTFWRTAVVRAVKILAEKDMIQYVLGSDGVYAWYENFAMRIIDGTFANATCINYNGNLICSIDGLGTYALQPTSCEQLSPVGYNSLAICGDRIIGVNSQHLVVTPAGEWNDWANAQTITTHVQFDAVVALGNKLYALGDTCYVLEPNAEELEVKFHPFAHNVGTVVADSVVPLGKRAVYATKDGLRLLTSDKITPIFTELNVYLDFTDSVACELQGRYVLSCKRKDGDMTGNDVILLLDVDNQAIVGVHGTGAISLSSTNNDLYAVYDTYIYKLISNPGSGYFRTGGIDMGNSDKKYLDRLVIKTEQNADVWIETEKERRLYSVKGKNGIQKIPITGVGREFAVEIHSQQDGIALDCVELVAHSYEV